MKLRYFTLSWLLVLVACKKEDTEPPTVSITSPVRNSAYNVYDAFWVEADLSDNKELHSVTIRVYDANNQPATGAITKNINGTSYHLKEHVQLDDIHLPSGTYRVEVQAKDKNNKKTSYVEISVTEVPRQLKRIIAFRNNGTTTSLDSVGTGQLNTFFTVSGDHTHALVNSYWQQVYLQGSVNTALQCYTLSDLSLAWSVPVQPNGSQPYYLALDHGDLSELTYSSNAYGYLRAYNRYGLASEIIQSPSGKHPYLSTETSGYVIAEHRDVTVLNNNLLSVHYKGSGTVLHSTPTNIKWSSMFIKDPNLVVLVGNDGAQGELRIYNYLTNVIYEPVNIPAGKVYDMVKIDDDNFVIAHQGGLLRYTYSNSSLVNITTGNACQCLAYDVLPGYVLAGEGLFLKGYNPLSGAQVFSYAAPDSIKNVFFQFNK